MDGVRGWDEGTGIARLSALRVSLEGIEGRRSFLIKDGNYLAIRLGESRPNVLKIKTKANGFCFLFYSCHRSSKLGSAVLKQKTSAAALVFIYPYSGRDLNPYGLMAIGF